MNRIMIKDIKKYNNQIVKISGFIKQIRDLKSMQFMIVRDITEAVQISLVKNDSNKSLNEIITNLTIESSVSVIGKVHVDDFVKLNGVEIIPQNIIILNKAKSPLPIDLSTFNESNRDIRTDWRFLDLRVLQHQLIFKIQTCLEQSMREFFLNNNFIEIHSPKIMGTPSEGGAELFELDYFEKKAYLAQSPQFYKQMAMAAGFEKVFEIGPVFRADKSSTSRHCTEFTGVDVEISFIDSLEDVLCFEEEWLTYVMTKVKEKFSESIKTYFNVELKIPKLPFIRIPMKKAAEIVKKMNYIVPQSTKGDLDPKAEKLLGEYAKNEFDSDFLFITEFPQNIRPFYHMRDKNGVPLSADLLMNGIEISTGAQREHRYDILKKQAIEKGIKNLENMKNYFEYFEFGCPPHGGFGIGLARVLANICGYNNIREVTFVYRDIDRLFP